MGDDDAAADAAAAGGDEAECDDGAVFRGPCGPLRCRLPAASIVSLSANGPPRDGQSFPAAPCTRRTAEKENTRKIKQPEQHKFKSLRVSAEFEGGMKTADGGDMEPHKLQSADDKGTCGMCVFVRDTRIHTPTQL